MNSQDKGIKIYSVSEAKLIESGQVTITGMIASMSTLYKVISKSEWECNNQNCNQIGSQTYTPALLVPPQRLDNTSGFNIKCFECGSTAFTIKHTYHNARTIQIEDINKTEDIDRLEVVVYDEASQHVIAGEAVDLTGTLYIQRKIDGAKGKKLVTILHSNKIVYKNKEKIIVTEKDIEKFHRWKKICDTAYKREIEASRRKENWSKKIIPMTFEDRLVAMFAPNVIGYNDKKLGLLRSLVGGCANNGNDNGRRGRINTLLVGDPGTAKSLLAREATRITPNSRFVTAQNASGKSLGLKHRSIRTHKLYDKLIELILKGKTDQDIINTEKLIEQKQNNKDGTKYYVFKKIKIKKVHKTIRFGSDVMSSSRTVYYAYPKDKQPDITVTGFTFKGVVMSLKHQIESLYKEVEVVLHFEEEQEIAQEIRESLEFAY